MNERIKELAEQAKKYALDAMIKITDKEQALKVYSESYDTKFAELIVAECIAQCEQVATDADAMTNSKFVTDAGRMLHEGMWGGAKNCTAQIQTHFGVEE